MKLINLVFLFFLFIFVLSCGKSFSGALIEKENNLNDATYIEADGPTYKTLEFGRKVDLQIYITKKEDSLGLVARATYQQFIDISIEKFSIRGDGDNLEFECSKRYSLSFFIQQEQCDALVTKEAESILEKIINPGPAIILFQGGAGEKNISFEMSSEQKEAFNLVLAKYKEIKS